MHALHTYVCIHACVNTYIHAYKLNTCINAHFIRTDHAYKHTYISMYSQCCSACANCFVGGSVCKTVIREPSSMTPAAAQLYVCMWHGHTCVCDVVTHVYVTQPYMCTWRSHTCVRDTAIHVYVSSHTCVSDTVTHVHVTQPYMCIWHSHTCVCVWAFVFGWVYFCVEVTNAFVWAFVFVLVYLLWQCTYSHVKCVCCMWTSLQCRYVCIQIPRCMDRCVCTYTYVHTCIDT